MENTLDLLQRLLGDYPVKSVEKLRAEDGELWFLKVNEVRVDVYCLSFGPRFGLSVTLRTGSYESCIFASFEVLQGKVRLGMTRV